MDCFLGNFDFKFMFFLTHNCIVKSILANETVAIFSCHQNYLLDFLNTYFIRPSSNGLRSVLIFSVCMCVILH